MSTFFDDLYNRFYELHMEIVKSVDSLPDEAMDWTAGPDMNSIGVLIVHLIGAERYWIGDVSLGKPSDRVREKEFSVYGLSVEELKKRLFAADDFCRDALARFSLKDLEMIRESPRNEKSFTVGWCLTHALEHTALHVGHIQLTSQLWTRATKQ
jgi:uncharacterized damage-inducible protein DinB